MDKELLFSRRKGAQLLRKQLINDIVCGYYSEEDAIRYYGLNSKKVQKVPRRELTTFLLYF
jgi:hypothetical protein